MNAPTLLIGLGGTGCKIVERVSKLATPEQRESIAYAVFDTDVNDLRGIKERNPFIHTIQTSVKQTVGEYISKNPRASSKWFPLNNILNKKTMTEGAGQVRAISRLAFESAMKAGMLEPLHEALQSLFKVEEDKPDQSVRVIIVSSLAGGTGSGLILPVGLYLRQYLESHFHKSSSIFRGFFILPEVFYNVIQSLPERNNLKANAYAALRELDAFLMKADGTLNDKYKKSVVIEMPSGAGGAYEDYSKSPYDYCFLFDAQNAEGGKLNSFNQYLDHAANCIYSQSIGPMNRRSNSSEDNTIRALAREKGRNRYAGAGASMLIYPVDDVKKFIALKWARENVSNQWLVVDRAYKEICMENAEKREKGINAQNPEPFTFYMNHIDSLKESDDAFGKTIYNSCMRYKPDGVSIVGKLWDEYVNVVAAKVKKDIQSLPANVANAKKSASNSMAKLNKSNEWVDYVKTYEDLQAYKLNYDNHAADQASSIAYNLFAVPKDGKIGSPKPFSLEFFMQDSNGNFLHPNAIRFNLAHILDYMKTCKRAYELNKKKLKDEFDRFEENTFDDTETEAVERPKDLARRKVALIDKLLKRPNSDQELIREKYSLYFDNISQYVENCVLESVFGEGIKYIDSILRSFDAFYKTFETKVSQLDKMIDDIYKRYVSTKGTTIRYVCASRECLDKIYQQKPFTGNSLTIDSELAKEIYLKVVDHAASREKPNNSKYFAELFDKGIIGYYENSVMKQYGEDIDIDIITAIEREAQLLCDYGSMENADELTRRYVVKVITDTRALSCPFIESPMGDNMQEIKACAFNDSLVPDSNDVSPRAQLIEKELQNFGGSPDDSISRNMIMFYQSFYGLRANDLSKFAPPAKTDTYSRDGGEYFKAYYELIEGIHPKPELSREISPHIDRIWHVISKMPDLDDGNQLRQEVDVYTAFFWAIACRYIMYYDDGSDRKIYRIKRDTLKMDNDQLYVSNGTECDKFYEVLDAVALYPDLVKRILAKVNSMIEDDINENTPMNESFFMTMINGFSVCEPCLGKENVPASSIFDIPMLMKKSANHDNFFEEDAINIIKAELKLIRDYIHRCGNERDASAEISAIIMDQFMKFLDDTLIEKEVRVNICRETLFDRVCAVIEEELRDIRSKKCADRVRDCAVSMRDKGTYAGKQEPVT